MTIDAVLKTFFLVVVMVVIVMVMMVGDVMVMVEEKLWFLIGCNWVLNCGDQL